MRTWNIMVELKLKIKRKQIVLPGTLQKYNITDLTLVTKRQRYKKNNRHYFTVDLLKVKYAFVIKFWLIVVLCRRFSNPRVNSRCHSKSTMNRGWEFEFKCIVCSGETFSNYVTDDWLQFIFQKLFSFMNIKVNNAPHAPL